MLIAPQNFMGQNFERVNIIGARPEDIAGAIKTCYYDQSCTTTIIYSSEYTMKETLEKSKNPGKIS